MERPDVIIIIPAYNEADSIRLVVESCRKYANVLVVDDGSTDNGMTHAEALAAGAEVKVCSNNLGYEKALSIAFDFASKEGYSYVITFDADAQFDSEDIPRYISSFNDGTDLICGVRNRQQRFSERIFSVVANKIWGLSDPLCGMKGYRMSLYHAAGFFSRGSMAGTELLIFCRKNLKLRYAEIPVKIKKRNGVPRYGNIFIANLKIIKACLLAIWKYAL